MRWILIELTAVTSTAARAQEVYVEILGVKVVRSMPKADVLADFPRMYCLEVRDDIAPGHHSCSISDGIRPGADGEISRRIKSRMRKNRFVLGAGSGIWPSEFDDLGDPGNLKVRAEMLDEGLELLQKTWSGDDFEHRGKYYQARGRTFCPGGAEIPIWLGASWPSMKPFRRAARFDEVMALNPDYANPISLDDVHEIIGTIAAHRDSNKPFSLGVALNSTNDFAADVERAKAHEARRC